MIDANDSHLLNNQSLPSRYLGEYVEILRGDDLVSRHNDMAVNRNQESTSSRMILLSLRFQSANILWAVIEFILSDNCPRSLFSKVWNNP